MNNEIKKFCEQILNRKDLKIIIWGFGKTGISILNFLKEKDHILYGCDKKHNEEIEKILKSKNGIFFLEDELDKYLKICDFIIPSPGILLTKKIKNSKKLITEFDLFSEFWKGEIFSITGSVGKTSTTTILYELLKIKYPRILIGGNIGIPVFDLKDKDINLPVILEVSNLQLENTKLFSPDYLIWTNIYKNHLDMHKNFSEYLSAKANIILNNPQKIKFAVIEKKTCNFLKKYKIEIPKNTLIFSNKNEKILKNVPPFSYLENWEIIANLLKNINIDSNKLIDKLDIKNFAIPQHRVEWCGKLKNGSDIYNDSKATIIESTFSALKKLSIENKKRSITLILGGKPKGVDRIEWILKLKKYAKNIIFFGEEKEDFKKFSEKNNLNIKILNTLAETIDFAILNCENNGIILFSPGGSSFDLFQSYIHRGDEFKKLIKEYL